MKLQKLRLLVIKNTIKIALVGQPNVGKSMLINSISNASVETHELGHLNA